MGDVIDFPMSPGPPEDELEKAEDELEEATADG